MESFGLLGKSLKHSYSPWIHEHLGLKGYQIFEVPEDNLATFLGRPELKGLNVTIPYKKSVVPFCQHLSPAAKAIGSVNTLIKMETGGWAGHNTDYYGFIYLLDQAGINPQGKKVIILGSGGASLTVLAALKDQGAREIIVVSRLGPNNYQNLNQHQNADLIIQSTPVGMYPENEKTPVSLASFPQCQGVVDLIYNPLRTRLMMEAQQLGMVVAGGLPMLTAQAQSASELFQQKKLNPANLKPLTKKLQRQMENLVLIGMPGSGKSTLGLLVAEKLGRTLVDTDVIIQERLGVSPSDIIKSQGEPEFRRLECAIIAEFGKQSGLVLVTGGGAVTQKENYAHLAQQGTIIWVERPLEALATGGRIISQRVGLAELYQQRQPLYVEFADLTFENNVLTETVEQIITMWNS